MTSYKLRKIIYLLDEFEEEVKTEPILDSLITYRTTVVVQKVLNSIDLEIEEINRRGSNDTLSFKIRRKLEKLQQSRKRLIDLL